MTYLKSGLLGNYRHHERCGGPTVGGVTLAPVSPGVIAGMRAIGGTVEVLTPHQVTAHCVALVEACTAELADFRRRLETDLASCSLNIDEATRLAANPVVGDEGEIILGMVAAVDGSLAKPEPLLELARHLEQVLPSSVGIDTAPVISALRLCDEQRTEVANTRDALRGLKAALQELREQALDPSAVAAAQKKRASWKASRALPPAIQELRLLRAEMAGLAGRVDHLLEDLEKVA